jgi:hypothetical protein
VSDPAKAEPGEPVADLDIIKRAGFDPDYFLSLPDFEQRLVLKMAERLLDAARRAEDSQV